jgi:ABC-type uncharacterized transport system auxiliary subunit
MKALFISAALLMVLTSCATTTGSTTNFNQNYANPAAQSMTYRPTNSTSNIAGYAARVR